MRSESPHVDLCPCGRRARRQTRASSEDGPAKNEKIPRFFKRAEVNNRGGAVVGWLSVSSLECGFLADRTSKSCFEGSQGHLCHSRQWGRSGVFCIGINGLGECGARDIGAGAGGKAFVRAVTSAGL